MPDGLLAPLSPQEEIALRRIAHNSFVVDARAATRLIGLALAQRTAGGLRLTPLGRLRVDALPKAPLLAHKRSVHAMLGYVEGLIEKAQIHAAKQAVPREEPSPPPPPITERASVLLETKDGEDESDEVPIYWPICFFFDSREWRSRAERNIVRTRRAMIAHRRRQEKLCDDSFRRIEASRALLKESVPVRPGWLYAGK